MSKKIICPRCQHFQPVEKVSSLYLVGLETRREYRPGRGKPRRLESALHHRLADSPELLAISHTLAPPSSGKQLTIRPIHPDQAVLVFSLIAPVFLYGMFATQPEAAYGILALLVLFYVAYLWQRSRLVARFQQQQAARRSAKERVQRGIERWMQLYYCAEDQVVFDPEGDEAIPVDQLPGYLLRDA